MISPVRLNQTKDLTRSFKPGGENPNSKSGSSGNSTSTVASTARKGEGDSRLGSSDKWKGV
jgi:hypothetical protein